MSEWISVKDRLPEMNGAWYLVHFDGYTIPEKICENGTLDTYSAQGQAAWYMQAKYGFGITHWMPLPPKPAKEIAHEDPANDSK